MGRDLMEYRSAIDEQAMMILGQMDSATKILDFLYLVRMILPATCSNLCRNLCHIMTSLSTDYLITMQHVMR